jgi:short-subunit dehydrogenase
MSSLGLDKSFFLDGQFLNEQYSIPFGIIYCIVFIFLGGFIPFLFSTTLGLFITILLQRFIINKREPLPIGQAIIITGCSTGIGKETALSFASKGLHVFATVRKEADGKILLASLQDKPIGCIIPLIVDVNNTDSIIAASVKIKDYVKNKGISIAGVINNAGYSQSTFLELLTHEELKMQYDTNIFGLIKFTNIMLPLLREFPLTKYNPKLNSKLIMVSSALTKTTLPSYGLYASTKTTLEALVDSYRQELSPFGIDVVSVQPGSIATQFTSNTKRTVLETSGSEPTDNDSYAKMQYYADGQEFLLAKEGQAVGSASDPSIVVDVFAEILSSPRPITRYNAGRDSHLMGIIFGKIPPAIISYFPVFNKFFGKYMKSDIEFEAKKVESKVESKGESKVEAKVEPKIASKFDPKIIAQFEQKKEAPVPIKAAVPTPQDVKTPGEQLLRQ